ncbi:MAG TPA: GntR family transcriptional regulator [Rhodocyclaceae bacterium]|nr:GntR family transcriptional regulator [Rhodocyclaceae bacterium]
MDPEKQKSPDSASVVATLRKQIMDGQYPAGSRIAEIPVAEALGVSRTPVRLAFRTLEQEGLLEKAGTRGFLVRGFSEVDVRCAIEVRGALEGLAARQLAERGLSPELRATLIACLNEGAAVLAKGYLTAEDIGTWSRVNEDFHRAIVGAADSHVVADAIARNNHLPFASADSIVIDTAALNKEYQKLHFAQLQHQLVFDALEQRESARVEMLMREHAYVGLRYGKLFGLKTTTMATAMPTETAAKAKK